MIEVIRSGETLQMLLNCWHDFFLEAIDYPYSLSQWVP